MVDFLKTYIQRTYNHRGKLDFVKTRNSNHQKLKKKIIKKLNGKLQTGRTYSQYMWATGNVYAEQIDKFYKSLKTKQSSF